MIWSWTSEHADLRSGVASLCRQFDASYWDAHDRDHAFPTEFFEAFAAGDWLSVMVAPEFGGSGLGISESASILEEVAASGAGLNGCSAVHIPQLAISTMRQHASQEMNARYLPSMCDGSLYCAFGVSEPDAGTDTTRIRTVARRDGDRYIVNGRKVWISGAQRASKVLLLTRTTKLEEVARKSDGMSLLLADLEGPGVEVRRIEKIGRNAVDSNEVFFDDHPVPATELVGTEGDGFRHLMTGLNGERILLAAEALGIGRWCIEQSIRYANERRVFGRTIGQNQAVQHPIARGYVELTAAALMVQRAAHAFDAGEPEKDVGALVNAAKYLATEVAFRAADHAMQVHGGYSYARDYNVGRLWIESRIQRIAPINNEMVLNHLSEHVLGLARSY